MNKGLKEVIFIIFIFIGFTGVFFWKVWMKDLLPIPADALVGMYHPFRDYYVENYPNGVPVKNYVLTDPVLQQYPWKWLAIEEWKVFLGKILAERVIKENPWQNAYTFGGYAANLVENVQAGTFYPLNIVFFIIDNFSTAWTVFIAIQPILAATFMYLYLKSLSLSRLAAILGGVVWAFSSFNLVWLEWGNIGHAGLYLPLALYSIDRIKRNFQFSIFNFQMKWILLLVLAMGMSLLAGHVQVTFYLATAVGLYSLLNKKFYWFLLSSCIFLLVTFFQWYPAFRFVLSSNRSVEQAGALTREGFFIVPKQLIQMIVPDFFGNPATLNYRGEWNYAEQIIYVGLIPLALAVLALFGLRSSPAMKKDCFYEKLRLFAFLLIAGGLLMAVRNPIAEIPYRLRIPLISDLQPTRLSYLITFGLAIFAAIGADNVIRRPKESFRKLLLVGTSIGMALGGLLLISSKFDLADKTVSQRNLLMPIALMVLLVGGVLLKYVTEKEKFGWFGLLVVRCLPIVICLDLFRFGWKFTPFSPREYLYPVTPSIKFLQENMVENDRYMTLDRRILPPNANIMYGIESIEGYDPVYPENYVLLVTKLESGENNATPGAFGRIIRPFNFRSLLVDELNVKYILSLEDITDRRWKENFREGQVIIYEKTN